MQQVPLKSKGHYARTSYGEDFELRPTGNERFKRVKLLKAMDRIKDQTLFLAQVPKMYSFSKYEIDFVPKIILSD